MHSIAIQHMKREGQSDTNGSKTERVSIDFVVESESLLAQLLKADGGHRDFMGCFVQGFAAENLKKKAQLASALQPDTEEGRYLLYLCPECGDIGCGAYGAKLRQTETTMEWYDFAYENGYEPGRLLAAVGPFIFARGEYSAALEVASAA
jgi:hypothetical protein